MINKIAFIGLGEMGLGMAVNLVKSGIEVYGFDKDQSICMEADYNGVKVCSSIEEAVMKSEKYVITMVRNIYQTEDVIFGNKGILSTELKDIVIIVMSTLDPNDLAILSSKVTQLGSVIIDAPVSGAKIRADEGSLTIMTAGDDNNIELCDPIFRTMGKNIFHFGRKIGLAQAAKLSNNLMLAINMIGCTEGLKLGKEFDLPETELVQLLKVSSGNSWVVENWDIVRKWWEEYKPNETLDIVHKDLFAIQKICFEKKLSLPVTSLSVSCLLDAYK